MYGARSRASDTWKRGLRRLPLSDLLLDPECVLSDGCGCRLPRLWLLCAVSRRRGATAAAVAATTRATNLNQSFGLPRSGRLLLPSLLDLTATLLLRLRFVPRHHLHQRASISYPSGGVSS